MISLAQKSIECRNFHYTSQGPRITFASEVLAPAYNNTPESQKKLKRHQLQPRIHLAVNAEACGDTEPSDCEHLEWKGDGECDDKNNVATCDWDGGDCCLPYGTDWNKYCQQCECLDPIPCPDDCTDDSHGSCDLATGTCTCVLGFKGDTCAGTICAIKHQLKIAVDYTQSIVTVKI